MSFWDVGTFEACGRSQLDFLCAHQRRLTVSELRDSLRLREGDDPPALLRAVRDCLTQTWAYLPTSGGYVMAGRMTVAANRQTGHVRAECSLSSSDTSTSRVLFERDVAAVAAKVFRLILELGQDASEAEADIAIVLGVPDVVAFRSGRIRCRVERYCLPRVEGTLARGLAGGMMAREGQDALRLAERIYASASREDDSQLEAIPFGRSSFSVSLVLGSERQPWYSRPFRFRWDGAAEGCDVRQSEYAAAIALTVAQAASQAVGRDVGSYDLHISGWDLGGQVVFRACKVEQVETDAWERDPTPSLSAGLVRRLQGAPLSGRVCYHFPGGDYGKLSIHSWYGGTDLLPREQAERAAALLVSSCEAHKDLLRRAGPSCMLTLELSDGRIDGIRFSWLEPDQQGNPIPRSYTALSYGRRSSASSERPHRRPPRRFNVAPPAEGE